MNMTTFSPRPATLDVQSARPHAYAPGCPSPLRECFDAEDLVFDADHPSSAMQAPKITLKFTVPILAPPPVARWAFNPNGERRKGSQHWSGVPSVGVCLAPSDKHTTWPPPSSRSILSEKPNLLNVYFPSPSTSTSPEPFQEADSESDENMSRYDDDPFKRARWSLSTSPSDARAATSQPLAAGQSFIYTPLPPLDPGTAIAAAARTNYDFTASLKRAPERTRQAKVDAQDHLHTRLRHFEGRRTELQAALEELKCIRRANLTKESDARANAQYEASQCPDGRASQAAVDLLAFKTTLRQWTDDDIKYDEHQLAKVETEIMRCKQFAGEITRDEPCSRTRLKLSSRSGPNGSREDAK